MYNRQKQGNARTTEKRATATKAAGTLLRVPPRGRGGDERHRTAHVEPRGVGLPRLRVREV